MPAQPNHIRLDSFNLRPWSPTSGWNQFDCTSRYCSITRCYIILCVIHLSELYRHFTLVESADSRSLRCNIVQKYSCAGNKGDHGKSPTLCLLISFSLALSLSPCACSPPDANMSRKHQCLNYSCEQGLSLKL